MSITHRLLAQAHDVLVGRLADGARLFVSIEVQHVTAESPRETTTHARITEWDEVSLTHGVTRGHRRDWDETEAGVERVAEATVDPSSCWSAADLASLAALAGWHLSGMNAGCDHVEVVQEPSPYGGTRPSLNLTPACTELVEVDGEQEPSGYHYGHAWLIRELPAEVRDELVRLAHIPGGKRPAWMH